MPHFVGREKSGSGSAVYGRFLPYCFPYRTGSARLPDGGNPYMTSLDNPGKKYYNNKKSEGFLS